MVVLSLFNLTFLFSTKGDGTDNSDNEEHREPSPDRSSPIYVPSNEHKLQYPYWLWFRRPGNRLRSNTVQYEQVSDTVCVLTSESEHTAY